MRYLTNYRIGWRRLAVHPGEWQIWIAVCSA